MFAIILAPCCAVFSNLANHTYTHTLETRIMDVSTHLPPVSQTKWVSTASYLPRGSVMPDFNIRHRIPGLSDNPSFSGHYALHYQIIVDKMQPSALRTPKSHHHFPLITSMVDN